MDIKKIEITRLLSDHENKLLDSILKATESGTIRTEPVKREHWDGSGTYDAQEWPALAYIAWVDDMGFQFGRVRWGVKLSGIPGQVDKWSASPFPGAWVDVPRSQIIAVRHPDTF